MGAHVSVLHALFVSRVQAMNAVDDAGCGAAATAPVVTYYLWWMWHHLTGPQTAARDMMMTVHLMQMTLLIQLLVTCLPLLIDMSP